MKVGVGSSCLVLPRPAGGAPRPHAPHPENGGENWRGELAGTARGLAGVHGRAAPAPAPTRDPGAMSSGAGLGSPDLPESQGSLAGRGGRAHLSRRIRHPRAHPVHPSARCPLGHPSPPVDGNTGLRQPGSCHWRGGVG